MFSSKPTPPDDLPSDVEGFDRQHPRRRDGRDSLHEYVELLLERRGLQLDLKTILRDPGTANLYRKYLELKLTGPRVPSLFAFVKPDRRG